MTNTPQERMVEQVAIDIIRVQLFGGGTDAIKERLSTLVRVAVERERAAIIEAAENERVSGETGDEGDFAYNNAIEHVVAAIRVRGVSPDAPNAAP